MRGREAKCRIKTNQGLTMHLFQKLIRHGLCVVLSVAFLANIAAARQAAASLRGQVSDELGGAISGVTVTLIDANNVEKTVTTNDQGQFVFNNIAPGKYFVRAIANGF